MSDQERESQEVDSLTRLAQIRSALEMFASPIEEAFGRLNLSSGEKLAGDMRTMANDLRDIHLVFSELGHTAALAARETEKTVWTCMSCGEIGEGRSCGNCGHAAMPGRWLEARGVERQLKDAWRQRDEALATREELVALRTAHEESTRDEGQADEEWRG